MTIKVAIEKLEKNTEFLEWKRENKDAFLSYAFMVLEKGIQAGWQIGYYSKKKDKITTFVFEENDVSIRADEEVFKKDDAKIVRLDIKKVNVSLDNALNYAEEFQKKKFPNEDSLKIIVILQNIPELGIIWNITSITKSFKILNMKVSADKGKMVKHGISSIFDLKQN